MVEREVTDILLGSIGTLLLFIGSSLHQENIPLTIFLIANFTIILVNSLHIILKQLNRVNNQQSTIVILINLILFIISYISFLFLQPFTLHDAWLNYHGMEIIILNLIYLVTGIVIFLSRNATLVE